MAGVVDAIFTSFVYLSPLLESAWHPYLAVALLYNFSELSPPPPHIFNFAQKCIQLQLKENQFHNLNMDGTVLYCMRFVLPPPLPTPHQTCTAVPCPDATTMHPCKPIHLKIDSPFLFRKKRSPWIHRPRAWSCRAYGSRR